TLVNAGHPPPVLIGADGSVQQVEATSPALGLFEDVTVSAQSRTLTPGSLMVAFTDGASEALDEGDTEFGEPRAAAEAASRRDEPASAICAALLDEVRGHCGSRPRQ